MTFTCPFENANLCTSESEEVHGGTGNIESKKGSRVAQIKPSISLQWQGERERAAAALMNVHCHLQ